MNLILIKNMINKIGIFSITLNRLYYTYHCFKSLRDKAGMPFEHIIIDNGSKDGTWEWLKEEGYNVIKNKENKGITFASIQGYRWLLEKKIDIIIKMDSDCEILTPNVLSQIDRFFSKTANDYIISPAVKGISTIPGIIGQDSVNGFKVNRIQHIGGIFRAMRMQTFSNIISQCRELNDKVLNDFFRKRKLKIGYLPELEVNHFETTKGQEIRYPEYFNRKYIY